MSKAVKRQRPVIPIGPAAEHLAELVRRVETGEPLTPVFVAIFQHAKEQHLQAVDQATTTADILRFMVEGAKGARDRWAAKAKALEAAQEELKASAMAAIEANPDLPWADTYGQKVTVCQNSAASLTMNLYLVDKTVRNVIDEADLERLAPYVKMVAYHVIDTDRVRAALAGGLSIPWATLERGRHVRGLNGSDPTAEPAGS